MKSLFERECERERGEVSLNYMGPEMKSPFERERERERGEISHCYLHGPSERRKGERFLNLTYID